MPTTPEPPAEEEFVGESRVNGSPDFKKAIADLIGGTNSANAIKVIAGATAPGTVVPQQISLHSTDPLSTGTGEVTGGGYARKAVTWTAATGGAGDAVASISGAPIQFDVPQGFIGWFGVWQGGTYLYGKKLNPQVTLSVAGKVTVTPSHSYGLNPDTP